MARGDDSKAKGSPNVLQVSLSPLTRQRLEALARAEFFGGTAPAVARRFIEDGIRRLVDRGWLGDAKLPSTAVTPPVDPEEDDD